jgi:hypothetical protein
MTSSAVAQLLLRQPFQPFTIHLPDDMDVMVDEPSQVHLQRGSQIIIVKTKDGAEIIIDLHLIPHITIYRSPQ